MRIEITGQNEASLVLHGRFDAHEAAGFRGVVDTASRPGIELRLDLSKVTFVDSIALAELLRALKQARARGGDLVLTSVSDSVRVILELTALTSVFRIGADADPGVAEVSVDGDRGLGQSDAGTGIR